MSGGDEAGPRPVPAPDRREQFAVLGGDGVRPLGGGEGGAGGHGDLVPEPVEDLHRDGIARQLGDAHAWQKISNRVTGTKLAAERLGVG